MDGAIRFNADILSQFLKTIYRGFDTENGIEGAMWREVLRVINEGIMEGLAKAKTPPTHEEDFYRALRHSNEVFAAFKVHTMGKEMAAKLYDADGKLKPFSKWVEDVRSISSHQVGSWLKTEYDTAVIRAHAAADWREFERNKDILPNLRWMPTTSKEPERNHRAYWKMKLTLPVDDPFWNEHHPGDRWNCKCSLEATDDPVVRPKDMEPTKPQRGLENNPGKDGHTFSDNHPYFPDKCSHCFAYKKSSLKNRLKYLFNNRQKDCYNCPYIKGCLQRMSNNGFKLEKVFKNGGKLYVHPNVDFDKNDYKEMKQICLQFAKLGHEVKMTPRLHFKSEEYQLIYGNLENTKFYKKCPDFSVDGTFYEYEGFEKPWKKKKVGKMLSHGMAQSDCVVINNTKGCSDRFIRKQIVARQRLNPSAFKEVWVYEKGKIRPILINRQFVKNNRGA